MVRDTEPRWDTGVWLVGTERVRFFGRWEGNGYTTLRLDKGPVEAFIGHPLVCNAPEVWLTLVEADARHLVVAAHNPTEKAIKVRVHKNQGFDLGPALDAKVTIPAGSSVILRSPEP